MRTAFLLLIPLTLAADVSVASRIRAGVLVEVRHYDTIFLGTLLDATELDTPAPGQTYPGGSVEHTFFVEHAWLGELGDTARVVNPRGDVGPYLPCPVGDTYLVFAVRYENGVLRAESGPPLSIFASTIDIAILNEMEERHLLAFVDHVPKTVYEALLTSPVATTRWAAKSMLRIRHSLDVLRLIGRLVPDEVQRSVLEALARGDDDTSRYGLWWLAREPGWMRQLCFGLIEYHENPVIRAAAVGALRGVHDPILRLQAVVMGADDTSAIVRTAAVRPDALRTYVGHADALSLTALVESIRDGTEDPDPTVAAHASRSLAQLRTLPQVDLDYALGQEDARLRREAVRWLKPQLLPDRTLNPIDTRYVDALFCALGDQDPRVRHAVVEHLAFAHFDNPHLQDLCAIAIRDTDTSVRQLALSTILTHAEELDLDPLLPAMAAHIAENHWIEEQVFNRITGSLRERLEAALATHRR